MNWFDPQAPTAPEPDASPVFKSVGGVDLRLHLFQPADHQPGERRPGLVMFFGGGWNGGTPGQFFRLARYLAGRGMVVASAEYRVFSRHGNPPWDCVSDGKSAVRWLRQHAGELGLDPGRLAAGGGSAGGQVAAACALSPAFTEPGEDASVSHQPNALLLFNPALDNGPAGVAHERVKSCWRDFSPLHNVGPGAPPGVIFVGTVDHVLPVATAESFQRKMRAAGAACDLWLYPGQPHGFFNYRATGNPYFMATLYESDRFFGELGWVTGLPLLPTPTVEARWLPGIPT